METSFANTCELHLISKRMVGRYLTISGVVENVAKY